MDGWLAAPWVPGRKKHRSCPGRDTLHLEPTVLISTPHLPGLPGLPAVAACLPACLACRGPAPLDADEIREAVEQLMLRRAPTALVRLIGKNAYAR